MKIKKDLIWVSSALKDLKTFPKAVHGAIGYALHRVQEGKMPPNAKPLKGFGSGVLEIVSDYDTNTYRAVYVVNIADHIYVLHCFQKKSKKGIETPKEEIAVIKQRLTWLKSTLKQ